MGRRLRGRKELRRTLRLHGHLVGRLDDCDGSMDDLSARRETCRRYHPCLETEQSKLMTVCLCLLDMARERGRVSSREPGYWARSALYFVSGSLSDTAGVKQRELNGMESIVLVCQDVKQAQKRESAADSVEHPSLMSLHDKGRNSEALTMKSRRKRAEMRATPLLTSGWAELPRFEDQ